MARHRTIATIITITVPTPNVMDMDIVGALPCARKPLLWTLLRVHICTDMLLGMLVRTLVRMVLLCMWFSIEYVVSFIVDLTFWNVFLSLGLVLIFMAFGAVIWYH